MRSNLCAHNWSIRLRSSRNRSLAEIIGTRGRVWRMGDVLGGPNISESSSVAFNVVVGSVIFFGCVSMCLYRGLVAFTLNVGVILRQHNLVYVELLMNSLCDKSSSLKPS